MLSQLSTQAVHLLLHSSHFDLVPIVYKQSNCFVPRFQTWVRIQKLSKFPVEHCSQPAAMRLHPHHLHPPPIGRLADIVGCPTVGVGCRCSWRFVGRDLLQRRGQSIPHFSPRAVQSRVPAVPQLQALTRKNKTHLPVADLGVQTLHPTLHICNIFLLCSKFFKIQFLWQFKIKVIMFHSTSIIWSISGLSL